MAAEEWMWPCTDGAVQRPSCAMPTATLRVWNPQALFNHAPSRLANCDKVTDAVAAAAIAATAAAAAVTAASFHGSDANGDRPPTTNPHAMPSTLSVIRATRFIAAGSECLSERPPRPSLSSHFALFAPRPSLALHVLA